MVENYKRYIEEISNKTGFVKSVVEKVDRLLNILEWINNHDKLSKLLVLKGGTAINIAIFDFPRLSVDIDFDLAVNISKDEMVIEHRKIYNLIVRYLLANDYKINDKKSKEVYALDSIVAMNNIDNYNLIMSQIGLINDD